MSDTQSIYKSALGLSETTCPSISKYIWTIITKYLALGCPVPIQDTSHHHPNDVETSVFNHRLRLRLLIVVMIIQNGLNPVFLNNSRILGLKTNIGKSHISSHPNSEYSF